MPRDSLNLFRILPLAVLLAAAGCVAGPIASAPGAQGAESDETRVAALFDSIADDPAFLRVFLRDMPKGGDLHNHLSGAPYAEEYLDWAAETGFCVSRTALSIQAPPCDQPDQEPAADLMTRNGALYEKLVDAMSVRALISGRPSPLNGHEQFFGSFDRFLAIAASEPGKSIASTRRVAAWDTVNYLELMYNPATLNQSALSQAPSATPLDFDAALSDLRPALPDLIAQIRADADAAEADALGALDCATDPEAAGCQVEVRFNCYGLRLIPEAALFHQLALCFALIEADPRFLGVSLVQPEDHPIAVTQYDRHMKMIAFFKSQFPAARISLHAGELTGGLVPAFALTDHIAKAIYVAGSERIGHGSDIAYEIDSRATLADMAEREIAVEINLVSNAVILGLEDGEHPLNLYLASGVPVTLSTDDNGVLRSDMTEQYVRAARDHGLSYLDLKTVARNSLHYAFLPGESLWADRTYTIYALACAEPMTKACMSYLEANPKAQIEWRLEQAFRHFEADILTWTPER